MRHEVGVRALRDGLSRWLARVRGGDVVVVTDHGRTVAVIAPEDAATRSPTWEAHEERLRARGLLVGGGPSAAPLPPLSAEARAALAAARIGDAVLEQRGEEGR